MRFLNGWGTTAVFNKRLSQSDWYFRKLASCSLEDGVIPNRVKKTGITCQETLVIVMRKIGTER